MGGKINISKIAWGRSWKGRSLNWFSKARPLNFNFNQSIPLNVLLEGIPNSFRHFLLAGLFKIQTTRELT